MLSKVLTDRPDVYRGDYYDPDLKVFFTVNVIDGIYSFSECFIPGKNKIAEILDFASPKPNLRIRMETPNGIFGDVINVSRDITSTFDISSFKFSRHDRDIINKFLENVVHKIPNDYVLCVLNASDEFIRIINLFARSLMGVSRILPRFPVVKTKIPEYIELMNRVKHFSLVTPHALGVMYLDAPNALTTRFEKLPTIGSTMFVTRKPKSDIPGLVGMHVDVYQIK